MERVVCLIIGYAFGLLQWAYLLGRRRGVDIRKEGSGNAGTTNMLRTFGLAAGLLTLVLDIAKCLVAVCLSYLLYRTRRADILPLLKVYTGAGVVLGHVFPFYLQFRGGKGIAASVGMILAFGDWRLIVIAAVCFVGLFVLTHYVSLGSLALMASFLVGVSVFCLRGDYGMRLSQQVELVVVAAVLVVLAFCGHRQNIARLLTGMERKTYLGSARRKAAEQAYREKLKHREEK